MKKIFVFLLFSLSTIGYSQDQLFKKDNSKVDVKILEINPTEIKYKLFTYQDGPTITVSKKEIALIIYQNGVHEVITSAETAPVTSTETPYIVYNNYTPSPRINRDSIEKAAFDDLVSNKNLVSFNIMEPLNGSLSINYIREFAKNYLHVYVPISFGFSAPYFTQSVNTIFSGNNYYYYNQSAYSVTISNFKYLNKTYEVGLGIHFQTSGRRAVTHFVGPYIGSSQFTGTYDKSEGFYDSSTGYASSVNTTDNKFTIQRTNIMLDNGVLFRVTKNFNIMMLAAVGYRLDTYKTADDFTKATNYNKSSFPLNAFKFGLSFGYRF